MFRKHIKKYHLLPLSFILIGAILSIACENDTKDIDRMANIQKSEAVDVSRDVSVIYSDSSIVKAELTAPEMRIYHDTTGNDNGDYEFKKGVLIIFYDKEVKELQRIKSDYAIQRNATGITEFRKNVVITKNDGSVINTEELIYDEKNKKYFGSQAVTAKFMDERGDMQGTSFTSDIDFNNVIIQHATGLLYQAPSTPFPSFGNQ
ncbi:LPS export ABC transporter periplasmic protein LptC [Sphingobacterium sp. HJSM2_6]|uniref:LPS export ABC transporter periplasmic protein LptC n=1 Tax=Sphingobacterium sp. HJSM2_6 TaxID=3366264 RepID=UPI003BD692BE